MAKTVIIRWKNVPPISDQLRGQLRSATGTTYVSDVSGSPRMFCGLRVVTPVEPPPPFPAGMKE